MNHTLMDPEGLNIHIYPSNFLFESRIERIASCLISNRAFKAVWMLGVSSSGLPKREVRPSGVVLHRIGIATAQHSTFRKIFAFLVFYLATYRAIGRKSVSCVNAHSLSVLPLALSLKLVKRCIVVYDTHELETETQSSTGARRQLAKLIERFCIKKVDKVFCVSDLISDWYEREYFISRPTTILNSASFGPLQCNDYLRKHFNLSNEKKIFVYVGLFAADRGIEQLLQIFEDDEGFDGVIVFIGFGSLDVSIRNSASYGIRVFIHAPVYEDRLGEILSSADFGVCMVVPTCLSYDFCMPNKLLQYLAAGLPVVVSPCQSLNVFVTAHSVGVVASTLSLTDLRAAVVGILELDGSRLRQRAREVGLQLSWERQQSTLIDEYKKYIE